MLTQVLPYPPDSGPKVKTYNVIKYLAQEDEVTLASFVRGDQSVDVAHLRRYCRAVHTISMERGVVLDGLAMVHSLLTGRPWMMVRDDRGAMRRLVDRLAVEQRFDVVHADQLNMCQYAARVPDAFKVLDAHNALWLLYKRFWETLSSGPRKWLLGRDWRRLKTYEGQMVREFDAVLAVSHEDRQALLEAAGQPVDITVIPIAIDTDEVTMVERVPAPSHILHIGTMFWPPNIDGVRWFLREIWPLIREGQTNVVVDVVGSRPPPELVAYAQGESGVNVTGYVADVIPYLAQAGVLIVPLRAGGGMRVKILNALAQGLPIVSTTLGAEGIAVTPGHDILLADEPADFANAVLRVLDNPALANRLRQNGRRLAEEQYDYRNKCGALNKIYSRAAPGPSARRENGAAGSAMR